MRFLWFVGACLILVPAFSGVYNGASLAGVIFVAIATTAIIRKRGWH